MHLQMIDLYSVISKNKNVFSEFINYATFVIKYGGINFLNFILSIRTNEIGHN